MGIFCEVDVFKGFCWHYERYVIVQILLDDKWNGPNDQWEDYSEGVAAVLGLCECFWGDKAKRG